MRKFICYFAIIMAFCFVLGAEEIDKVNNYFISAKSGTKIYSMEEGTVLQVGYNSDYGNFIKAKYSDTRLTITYCNLSKMNVKKGQMIRRGTQLGTVGATGIVFQPGITIFIEFDENGLMFNQTDIDIPKIIHLFDE